MYIAFLFFIRRDGVLQVSVELRQAVMRTVKGVPNFTIGGKVVLSGAQEPPAFQQAFESIVQAS